MAGDRHLPSDMHSFVNVGRKNRAMGEEGGGGKEGGSKVGIKEGQGQ